ncbi:family 43 glycosylhydrolase [Pedobacter chitinilyticus]|uniref:Beta-xylosidase n=1 Tax=Pedobacter chitinilyticus TaxID=2233776 RepID=A0A3S3SRU8_9SPHI|nr:family 43 glycosylhydrolase [Pedobacter chitinilyticus]RWU04259.1 beta-xylosidase [Pedobacter chitinilyticus]
MNHKGVIKGFLFVLAVCGICSSTGFAQKKKSGGNSAYLFTYFTGNTANEEAIRFAISKDGYTYTALNGNEPVITSAKISSTGGVRDPHILRGADGKTFYLVVTDMVSAKGWSSNRAMVLLKSTDLINWSSSVVNIQKRFANQENLLRVWAPQTIYDPQAGKYMIYWSMKHGDDPDKIYYAYANKDFTDLESEPKQLFFSPSNGACIDGDIIYHKGKYHLFFKTEGQGNGIKQAVSDRLTEGYVQQDKYLQQTTDAVEGAAVFKLNNSDDYILMYDVYMKGKYQFTKSSDLENFKVVDEAVSMDFHPRHGTVLPINEKELQRLLAKWYHPIQVLSTAKAEIIKTRNILVDTLKKTVFLPLKNGANLKAIDPLFQQIPYVNIAPKAPYDFSKGSVKVTINITGQKPQIYTISASVNHNPVLNGYFADPEILYSNKTKKYHLYPTSDGYISWSGTSFKSFSSTDLVNWKDEGILLDLPKDVSWAKRNAWAPTMAERKINGEYKYFYYFTAAQKIGVAVSDSPTGPFKDSGKALITKKPAGIRGGQEIDPDVFVDPQTQKAYLYWGNGYMAGSVLNDDMISIDTNSIKVMTPDATFREGTEVFYRNGKYYFLWSEDDTRSENYRVRYGYSDSPTGKITVPENNLILAKDAANGIFGTGHNSVIQVPGKDEWYIVYHRFTRPKGITMGNAAGYNREVCIDKMEFNSDGSIKKVVPTVAGIQKLK